MPHRWSHIDAGPDVLKKRAQKGNMMSDLKLNSDDIRKLQKSIDLTQDRGQ